MDQSERIETGRPGEPLAWKIQRMGVSVWEEHWSEGPRPASSPTVATD